MSSMKFEIIIIVLLMLLLLCCPPSQAQVVFVDIPGQHSSTERQLESVCHFYGLDIIHLDISNEKERGFEIVDALIQSNSRAIVIGARALASVDLEDILCIPGNKPDKRIFVLIVGLTPEIDSEALTKLSKGAVVGTASATGIVSPLIYKISALRNVSRQLAGLELPITTKSTDYLIFRKSRNTQTIVQFKNSKENTEFPIFLKSMVDGQEVFFLTQNQLSEPSAEPTGRIERARFLEIAPLMMFLQYACGERCWHSPGYYANLTIDDPWLIEPYGHLSYVSLLEEMEKHNFHTTIAFIPWNYDRSAPDVVSLFHDHRDRFSICIHGNNHDHYEFYKYETSISDPWPAKPLGVQEANIKQAIARMEEFRKLTGLPYDPVFVFPHGIAPPETLGLLKKYNFLATSNARNVPLGSNKPNDALFRLKPVTLSFENFASLRRNEAKGRAKADIAIDLFLGNPILLYGHHNLFKGGIDSPNRVADVVNRIEPSVEWQSLGFICRHLYLQRIRNNGNYDVRAFCKCIELENTHKQDLTYFYQKKESFEPPIRQVTIDGEPYPYERSGDDLSLTITIPAGESRVIDIEYENALDLTSIDIAKNDPRVNRLRKLSDFRDMTVSKNVLGRAIIHMYYETNLYKLGLERLALICFVLCGAIGVGGWYLLRYIRRHRVRVHEIDGQIEV